MVLKPSCRRPLLAALVALSAISAAHEAHADTPPPEVRLSLSEYETLMAKARERGGPVPGWTTGTASAEVPSGLDGSVVVTITADVSVSGSGPVEIPLLPAHVMLESATFDGREFPLAQRGGVHVAVLNVSGDKRHNVSLRYRVPVRNASDDARVAVVPVPPVPGLALSLAGATESTVDVWPGGDSVQGANRIQLPAGAAFVLRWGDSRDVVRRTDYRITIDPGSDGATVEARIEVFLEGSRALVPLMPAHVALTDVREDNRPLPTRIGKDHHRAVVTGAGRHVITATFRMGIDRSQGQPLLSMAMPKSPMTRIEARVPGKRTVQLQPPVPVTHRIDGDDPTAVTTAIADLPPTEQATITWTEPRSAPEQVTSANTETWQLVKIEEGVVRSRVEIRYEIIRGSLRELVVELPENAVLYRVSGDGIEDWRTFAATESDPRQARIFLGTEQEGSYRLELELEQIAPQTVGQALAIPIIRPLGASREMGVVALFDGSRVGFAEANPEGYLRSGEDALPADVRQKLAGDIVSQAFKHIGPPGPIASAIAAARTREIRFDAHVESLYTFQQNALTAHSSITIDVKSGRTDRVVLSLPRGVKVGSDLSAPSLKKADWVEGASDDGPRRDFEIVLTRALEGTFRIEFSFEVILGSELGALELPDIRVNAADVKKGDFGIASDPGMEVDQKSMTGLRKLDVSELPNSVRLRSRREVQLGYSYSWVDEPWALALDVRRHKTVETLTAAITQARVESTLLPEGDIVHIATFVVDNKDRPWLKLTLPASVRVLGVLVDGERFEPIADDSGALKIQLRKQTTSTIALAWMERGVAAGALGSTTLAAPQPDVFMTDFLWSVRIPKSMSLASASSDLTAARDTQSERPESGLERLVRLPDDDTFTTRVWKADVLDVGDVGKLAIGLSVISVPKGVGTAIFVLSFVLLGFAIWRRVARGASTRVFAALAGGGLLLLVAGAVLWGMGGGPAAVFVLGLGVVAFMAWLQRRGAEVA